MFSHSFKWVGNEDSVGIASKERHRAHPLASHTSSTVQSRAASSSRREPSPEEDVDMEDVAAQARSAQDTVSQISMNIRI